MWLRLHGWGRESLLSGLGWLYGCLRTSLAFPCKQLCLGASRLCGIHVKRVVLDYFGRTLLDRLTEFTHVVGDLRRRRFVRSSDNAFRSLSNTIESIRVEPLGVPMTP